MVLYDETGLFGQVDLQFSHTAAGKVDNLAAAGANQVMVALRGANGAGMAVAAGVQLAEKPQIVQ